LLSVLDSALEVILDATLESTGSDGKKNVVAARAAITITISETMNFTPFSLLDTDLLLLEL
jgi:hypothetical protein